MGTQPLQNVMKIRTKDIMHRYMRDLTEVPFLKVVVKKPFVQYSDGLSHMMS